MRSWVSSAPPKIGRMSQSSRASKPSKSCEHSCQTQSNTIVEYNRTQLSNCSVFWELPPLLIDRIFLEHSWKTFAPPLHWRLVVAVFDIHYYEKVEAGSIEGVAFILSSFISRRKSNVGSSLEIHLSPTSSSTGDGKKVTTGHKLENHKSTEI